MAKYVLIEVEDTVDQQDIIEVIMREYEARGCGIPKYADNKYYTVGYAAEDFNAVEVLTFIDEEE